MTDTSGPDGSVTGSEVQAGRTTAEAKRLAARRRFLLGGASAIPLIVTLGQKEAWAASAGVCQSLYMVYDEQYDAAGGLTASLYCDPGQL